MVWKEERSRIRAVQMDNLKGLIGIRRLGRVPNTQIRELCGVMKGLDESIGIDFLQWFGHVEIMENNMIAKRVYIWECAGIYSVGSLQKRWTVSVIDCLKKEVWMSGKQGEWCITGVNAWGLSQGMKP